MPTLVWPEANPPESKAPRVVAASALLPHKHLDIVIASCEKLISDGHKFGILICGKTKDGSGGSYEASAIEMARQREFIQLEPWASDWTSKLRDRDIFVHLGQPESFGLVVLEAFARGLRLVVLPRTFLDDLPEETSKAGIHPAKTLSSKDVAIAIKQALIDPVCTKELYRIRATLQDRFSPARAAEEISAIYRAMVDSVTPRE